MESVTIAQAELDKMLANAAAGGDAKAQALSLEQQLWAPERPRHGRLGTRQHRVVERRAGGEPAVDRGHARSGGDAHRGARALSGNWNDYTLRVGPDGAPVEQRAFMQAWQLLACDNGYPCDDTNPRVLSVGCAYQGHCNAQNLADYIYYYGASPNDSQLMNQYVDILRTAIQTGNWSQVNVARGPRPPAPPNGFGPGGE